MAHILILYLLALKLLVSSNNHVFAIANNYSEVPNIRGAAFINFRDFDDKSIKMFLHNLIKIAIDNMAD